MSQLVSSRTDQRRSRRFPFHVDVDVSDKRGVRRGRAIDVSRHGLFIALVDPPQNRHLVQLVIHLPAPFQGTVQAAATVSRTLAGQGVGLSLFALSDEAKRRWDHFIASVQHQHQQAPPPGEPTGIPSFLLRLKTRERLEEFERTHVKVGGTVLFTPVLLPPGSPIAVVVVHPRTQQEHMLIGRVHRAIGQHPKRLEILFGDIDHPGFAAFVSSGQSQVPAVVGAAARSMPPGHLGDTSSPPVSAPAAPLVPAGTTLDDDLDIEIFDGEMQEDPISWDLRPSQLPVFVGERTPPPPGAPGVNGSQGGPFSGNGNGNGNGKSNGKSKGKSKGKSSNDVVEADYPAISGAESPDRSDFHFSVVDSFTNTSAAGPAYSDDGITISGGGNDDELMFDDTQSARDPGLRPTPVRLSCDGATCQAESYVVELGACSGVLGLVADLVPFWSTGQGRVVSVPRLIDAPLRGQRFQGYLGRGGQIEDAVSLSTFLAAADLAEPAHHSETAEPLKSSRAIERLAHAARRIGDDDATVPTKVKCPHCKDGHLVLQRA